ncbi:unnamed protein product [Trifolium pratense]|uniref:Uncharacterized protein n=1 Tax=Trifolium pratense TaxID=57577 RepID=A0ACB0KRC0_TRIPR|nr:unnamed protein product [Trifolium pratense]
MLKEMKYHVQEHISGWEDMFSLGGGYLHLKLQGACGSLVLDNSALKCDVSFVYFVTTKDRGQWKVAAQSQELIQTIQHYYNNTYLDGTKAINMSTYYLWKFYLSLQIKEDRNWTLAMFDFVGWF